MSRNASILILAAIFCAISPAATTIRIACGSSTGGTDAAGHAWQADAFYSGGTAYYRADMSSLDLPYRALRYGAFTYNVPTSPGKFTVTLSFLENRTAASVPPIAPGQRKIAVAINGTVVIEGLDIFALAGSVTPYSVVVPVTSTGPLVIAIAGSGLTGLLSGIQVDSVDAPPPPPSDTVGIKCVHGKVVATDLTAASPSQEITILSGVPGNTRWEQITLSEHVRFMGRTDVAVALSVSAGRPGPTNNNELTGVSLPLEVSSNDTNYWTSRPIPPQLSGSYDVVLNFSATPGNVNQTTAGELAWEACTYLAPAVLIGPPGIARLRVTPPQLVALDTYANVLRARVVKTDGTGLEIYGVPIPNPPTNLAWTPVR